MAGGLQEPRIFTSTPKWVGLKEIDRTSTGVWFKTKTGRHLETHENIAAWETQNKKKSNLFS